MTTKFQTYLKYKPSGIDWLGDIPDDWTLLKNRSAVSRRRGEFNKSEATPVLTLRIRGVRVKTDLSFGKSTDSYVGHQLVYPGDLVFTPRDFDQTPILSGVTSSFGCISNLYFVLKTKPGVDAKFLNYYWWGLKYGVDYFRNFSSGMRFSFNYFQFKEIPFLKPSFETQKRIVDFLDEKTKVIDELIEKKERLIELLREKRAALITRAVAKGLDPNAKLKPSGVDWFGDIPEGWEIKKIKHIASANKKSLSEDSTDPDYEFDYVDIGNVNSEGKILELQNYFFANAPARARRLAENDDVILSTVRTYLRSMARIENAKGLVFSTGFAIFHPTKILASQLYWSMQSEIFLAHVMANSTGVNYPGINEQKLSSIPLPVPSEQEQKQIADFLDAETAKIDKTAVLIESQIDKLKEYRSSLIYHAVTGKINI